MAMRRSSPLPVGQRAEKRHDRLDLVVVERGGSRRFVNVPLCMNAFRTATSLPPELLKLPELPLGPLSLLAPVASGKPVRLPQPSAVTATPAHTRTVAGTLVGYLMAPHNTVPPTDSGGRRS
jgi:hypothetical protein